MQGADILTDPISIFKGAPFSFTLLLILATHEFGHYYYSYRHNVDATLPYFIPAPQHYVCMNNNNDQIRELLK